MVKVGRCVHDEQGVEFAHGPCHRGDNFFTCFSIHRFFFLSLLNVIEVAGPSGGTARPRDVEMTRTRLEEKGIGCHRDFTEGFLQSVQPFL